jgi:uncharacterized protein YbbC (DUF1343 family)
MKVQTGLDILLADKKLQRSFNAGGGIGYLCHSASVTAEFEFGAERLRKLFGSRLKRLFSPQHGIFTDVQANMIESQDLVHPYLKLPVTSLYAESRIPSEHSLKGINHLIVDLQDIGTRIYTYIWTLSHVMEACRGRDIIVWVLDRPNPIGGLAVEGNTLDPQFSSFVGRYPMPMRHGLTIGEVALYLQNLFPQTRCALQVVQMRGWKRGMFYEDTGLPFVPPSPNIPTTDSCFAFVGSVIFEGTNISEGRGTTRPFEFIGHPKIEPYSFRDELVREFSKANFAGFKIRPAHFIPTFDKHRGELCGGFQILVTDRKKFKPWQVFHTVCRSLYRKLESDFKFIPPPYEYERIKLPIDILNGTDRIRQWYRSPKGSLKELNSIEADGMSKYRSDMRQALLYRR